MPGSPAVTGISYVQIVLRPESAAACMDGYATLGYQRKGTFTSCCLTTTMTRGTARILISQPRTRPCACGAQDHLLEYGEGVFDIGLAVLDAGVSWDFAVTAGAESLLPPRYRPLRDLTSMTSAAAIRVPGTGIRHSLLSHPEQAAVAVTEQEWIGYVRINVAAGGAGGLRLLRGTWFQVPARGIARSQGAIGRTGHGHRRRTAPAFRARPRGRRASLCHDGAELPRGS